MRQGPLRLRLYRPSAPADQAADPARRCARQGAERRSGEPRRPISARRPGTRRWMPLPGPVGSARAERQRYVAGFGSAKCSNEEAYLFQKLIRQGFGHNNVDHCTRLCHASSVAALAGKRRLGCGDRHLQRRSRHADVAIVIGANPTENHPVAATYFKQFAKRGGKLIVMDPRGQGLQTPRLPHAAVQAGRGCLDAERDHACDRRGRALRPAVYRGIHRELGGDEGPSQGLPAREDGRRSAASRPRSCATSPAPLPAPRPG